jgi:hypothetical protein
MLIPRSLAAFPILASCISAQGPLSGMLRHVLSGFKAKSAESTLATFAELEIGLYANDNSKIINITDANWRDHWDPQSTEEWLVEFTANPEHCASCELVDLIFNVLKSRPSPG